MKDEEGETKVIYSRVPEDVHKVAKARAALKGVSLAEHVMELVREDAQQLSRYSNC